MIKPYPWPHDLDAELQDLESTQPWELGTWIRFKKESGHHDGVVYLLLALASARWVDHHGPYIGHGTFNGGPVFSAGSILTGPYRFLALLQTASYVVDLLHHPNYGPYTLMDMAPITEASLESSHAALLASVEAGNQQLMAEHRLVGLLQTDSLKSVRWLLLEAALRQFSENEHRLLIIHRSAQLLDDIDGWTWAEPIIRPVVQYLSSDPSPLVPDESSFLEAFFSESGGPEDPRQANDLMTTLVESDYGTEPALLLAAAHQGHGLTLLAEASALAGAEMLGRSGFDAHAVTGIHAASDLVREGDVPVRLRALALAVMLQSQRTRRQKAIRNQWRPSANPAPRAVRLVDVTDGILADASGHTAWEIAASYLRSGGDPGSLARVAMETALTSAGPFDAIHNVKMVWGQLIETRRSHHPTLAWRHLAAGVAAIATTVNKAEADPVLDAWARAGFSEGPG